MKKWVLGLAVVGAMLTMRELYAEDKGTKTETSEPAPSESKDGAPAPATDPTDK